MIFQIYRLQHDSTATIQAQIEQKFIRNMLQKYPELTAQYI